MPSRLLPNKPVNYKPLVAFAVDERFYMNESDWRTPLTGKVQSNTSIKHTAGTQGDLNAAISLQVYSIANAIIFDGVNEKLREGMDVLVEGNKITTIKSAIPVPEGAIVIDAKGRVLMLGLIDAH